MQLSFNRSSYEVMLESLQVFAQRFQDYELKGLLDQHDIEKLTAARRLADKIQGVLTSGE